MLLVSRGQCHYTQKKSIQRHLKSVHGKFESKGSISVYPFTVRQIEIAQNNMHNHYNSVVPIFQGGHALQLPTIETENVTNI